MVPVDADHPGLLVLDRCWSIIGMDEPHFHLDLPWRRLGDAGLKTDDRASFDRASREALAQPWSFIDLLGGRLYAAVGTAAAQLRALEAADAHRPVLAAVGARYTQGATPSRPAPSSSTARTAAASRAATSATAAELGHRRCRTATRRSRPAPSSSTTRTAVARRAATPAIADGTELKQRD
jgi:hypothetical protein